MKILMFVLTMIFLAMTGYSQTVDGQFITNIAGSNYQVIVEAKMQSGTGSAGVVAIWFTFNASGLSFPASPVAGVDFIVQGNFTTYNTQNITKFGPNEVRINLVTSGTPAPLSTIPTAIVVLNFTIIDVAQFSMLTWTKTEIAPAFLQPNYTIGNWPSYSAPLPVELSSFTASSNQNAVNLKWQTATEVNNYGFEVERSVISNEERNLSWQKVGFVNGNGNSNSPKTYSFSDNNPSGGSKFQYRLKQIDNDGQFEYSDAVEVMVIPMEYNLYQNYPNPFNPTTKIKFALPEAGKVVLKIYDMTGAEVAELVNTDYEVGYYDIELNASNLASGVYFYRLQSNNFTSVKKLIVLK